MLLATLPSRYASVFNVDWASKGEVWPDGQAKYVPQGLRVVEALLAQRFPAEEIAVCYADELDQFLGEDTRVVGIHAHNPLGITFATDVYAYFYGADVEPINAEEFRRLHYDTANATSAPAWAALMKLVPTSQITFGSDYPYFPLNQIETIRQMGLPAADLHAIESGNAARLVPRLASA